MAMFKFSVCIIFVLFSIFQDINCEIEEENSSDVYIIEGKVFPPDVYNPGPWQANTRVMVNGGDYIGFLK